MFEKKSLMTRIAVAKGLGFVFGIIAFAAMPVFAPESGAMFRWGLLFWYTTMGAMIGLFGVFDWHPLLRLPMPWWFRGLFLGGWLNLLLVFLMYDDLALMMVGFFGEDGLFRSPLWFVVDGAIAGLLIDWIATKTTGEGPQIAMNDQSSR